MHEAKFDSYMPISNGDDGFDIIADRTGIQVNVIIDGTCAYRLNIDEDMMLNLVEHSTEKNVIEMDLLDIYKDDDESDNDRLKMSFGTDDAFKELISSASFGTKEEPSEVCIHRPCETCEEEICEYME